MMLLTTLLATTMLFEGPNELAIGRKGTLPLDYALTDLASGKQSTPADFAKAAAGDTFVFLGESHTDPEHHKMQAEIIDALAAQGRDVVVGFEMFTRPNQANLNPWTMGFWSKDEFIANSNWKKEWGFDYDLYSPIFEVTKARKLPMVALNVPRDWVRTVGKSGWAGLGAEEKKQVPEIYLGNKDHKAVFTSMMGGHPMTGPTGDNMYAAQVLWDEGMADTAVKYLANRYGSVDATPKNTVFVIVAGAGHGMYKQGINYRIKRHTGKDTLTLTMLEGPKGTVVSRGLGDFAYLTPELPEK